MHHFSRIFSPVQHNITYVCMLLCKLWNFTNFWNGQGALRDKPRIIGSVYFFIFCYFSVSVSVIVNGKNDRGRMRTGKLAHRSQKHDWNVRQRRRHDHGHYNGHTQYLSCPASKQLIVNMNSRQTQALHWTVPSLQPVKVSNYVQRHRLKCRQWQRGWHISTSHAMMK